VPGKERGLKSIAFACPDWHAGPKCVVSLVPKGVSTGIGVMLWCATCRCACDLEATGQRVSVTDSFKPGAHVREPE